jgi:hypothetical protein
MTEDERRRAREIYDEMMGTSPARTEDSESSGEGAAPSSPATIPWGRASWYDEEEDENGNPP